MDITTKIGVGLLVLLAGFYIVVLFVSNQRMKKLATQLDLPYNPLQYFFFFFRTFNLKGQYRGHTLQMYSNSRMGLGVQVLIDDKSISHLKNLTGQSRSPLNPQAIKSEIDQYIDSL